MLRAPAAQQGMLLLDPSVPFDTDWLDLGPLEKKDILYLTGDTNLKFIPNPHLPVLFRLDLRFLFNNHCHKNQWLLHLGNRKIWHTTSFNYALLCKTVVEQKLFKPFLLLHDIGMVYSF
jgi:hypothetical protein